MNGTSMAGHCSGLSLGEVLSLVDSHEITMIRKISLLDGI